MTEYCRKYVYGFESSYPCGEEAEIGSDFCPEHREYASPFDNADEAYEALRDQEWL